jgi:anti-anti-sigma factor
VANELTITVESPSPGVAILRLRGPLNSVSSHEFSGRVQELLDQGKLKLIFDLAEVPHVSSAGVSVFVSAISYAQDRGGDIIFINLRDSIRNGALKMLGLSDMIKVAESADAALLELQSK